MPEYVWIIGLILYAVSVTSRVCSYRVASKMSSCTMRTLEVQAKAMQDELGR